jgi:hypothetical protein
MQFYAKPCRAQKLDGEYNMTPQKLIMQFEGDKHAHFLKMV